MASMSSCTESRIHKDPSFEEPLLNRDKCFETDSKFSLSSFASTRLPPLSNFSGPSTYLPASGQVNSGLQINNQTHSQDQGSTYKGSGVLSSATVTSSSYPPKARSNFLLGPTKSVIFANNNDSNKMQKTAATKYAPASIGSSTGFYSVPPSILKDQMSIAPNGHYVTTYAANDGFKGVDENIYHWKVLNLSRAKLKASSRTSALLSGFAMVAMVEIQIDDQVPEWLLVTFSACTVLLIAVHMLALMISTCILPNVEAVANLHFQTSKTVFESPHMKMNAIVELAWGFSTVLGILLFLVEIAILCWVKFYNFSQSAAWTATGLLIPIMVVFIAFAAHFYLKLVSHKSEVYEDNIKELELLQGQLSTAEEGGKGDSENDQNVTASAGAVQIV